MVRVDGAIVIRGMATCTCIWRIGVITVMARGTIVGNFSVGT